MEIETEISTPADSTAADTSTTLEPTDVETSSTEPAEGTQAAETETQDGMPPEKGKLYAGKYKSVEELEKGYSEAQKFVSKASEFEKKYNELIEKQTQEAQKLQAEKLQEAQRQGYNDIESAEISRRVQLAELEMYTNGLQLVNPDDYESVRQCLLNYYNTGNKGYLNEAKRYYPSEVIEQVTAQKFALENNLKNQYQTEQAKQAEENSRKLADTLKTGFNEFLGDMSENQGKAEALKAFCQAGFITSEDDMKTFADIYGKIAEYEKALAIKEYEAAKTIEETKNKAQIATDPKGFVMGDVPPTYEQICKMSQDEFNKACEKWGEEKIIRAK